MDKRFLMVGVGLIAAIAVVTLAILAGGPRRSAPGPAVAPTPPTITNRGISQEDLDNLRVGTQDLVEVVQDFQLYSEDGDTVTVFTGDQVVPQPNFVADVVRPAAEVRSSDRRVLRITADAGRFYHPGNEPTRGEFHQNTVVTQYQAPANQPLDLRSDDHVQFRLYLDELTRFDRENGHITSEGPVRLVGPAVDFTGTGLDLTFNLLDQRVERLVIAQGKQLRLAQNSTLQSSGTSDNASAEDPASSEIAPPADETPANANPADDATQPYRVVLYDNLDILVGPDHTSLAGDRLEVLFNPAPAPAPGSDAATNSAVSTQGVPTSVGMSTPRNAAPRLHRINNRSVDKPIPAADPRALLTPAPDDVVVKWTGRLELTPLRPADADADDNADASRLPAPEQAVLTLHGQPAVLNNPAEAQHITAAAVGYRTAGQTVFATGSEAHPLTLNSPELGDLTAASLALSQTAGGGQILGPGQLVADEQGLNIAFADHLDLNFHQHADDSLAGLESATFHGNVHAVAASEDPDQQLDLTSQSLALSLTPDATGQPQPSHLQALGTPDQPVVAQQPSTTFTAQSLDIDLGVPTSVGTDTTADSDASNDLEITRLRALGNITVELLEEQTTLTAHALDADPRVGRLELFGENDRSFATLNRDGAALAGVHLILQENAQTADALGPGTFSAAVDENDPTAKLNVAWSTSMAFDNTTGQANFVGNVRAASTSATDDTSLDAHTLALEFVPQDFENADHDSDNSATLNAMNINSGGALDLRRVRALADPDDADQQINFTAQTFASPGTPDAPTDGRPLTRVTLIGRELLFINQPPNLTNATPIDDNITIEQVIVPTRGRMLLEDYRTPGTRPAQSRGVATPRTSDDNPTTNSGGIDFAGRGVTLFAWEDQLTLDAQANDLRLEKDVYMLHRPEDGGDPIKLDAQRLVADLTETGGLGAFLRQNDQQTAPQAQIRQVNADGRVRIAQGPSNIVADHLEYTEATRSVILWAEPRREVELIRDDQPNGRTTARALRWDLDNDLFTALEPGSNLIPIE